MISNVYIALIRVVRCVYRSCYTNQVCPRSHTCLSPPNDHNGGILRTPYRMQYSFGDHDRKSVALVHREVVGWTSQWLRRGMPSQANFLFRGDLGLPLRSVSPGCDPPFFFFFFFSPLRILPFFLLDALFFVVYGEIFSANYAIIKRTRHLVIPSLILKHLYYTTLTVAISAILVKSPSQPNSQTIINPLQIAPFTAKTTLIESAENGRVSA